MNSSTFDVWELLVDLDYTVTAPLLDVSTRISIVAAIHIFFYNFVHQLHRVWPDSILYPMLAYLFGVFNLYLLNTWDVLCLAAGIPILHGLMFGILLTAWRKRREGATEGLHVIKNAFKVIAVLASVCGTTHFNKEADVERFIIPFIAMTTKMISASEHIMQRVIHEKLVYNEHIGVRESFEVAGYLTFPAWISFKDFKSLPIKNREKNDRWRSMMYSAAARAALLNILSYKHMDDDYLGNFWGRSLVLYIIHGFQKRCRYYQRAQIAELEIISLGIKKGGWRKHYIFDFMGSECSIIMTDFLIGFNIPMSSYARNGFSSGDRSREMFLLFVVAPLVVIFVYNPVAGIMWLLFFMSIISQMSAMGGLVTGSRTFLRLLHYQVAPPYRQRGGPPPVYMGYSFKLLLIFFNQLRLAAMFNLKLTEMRISVLLMLTLMLMDFVTLTNILKHGTPQHITMQAKQRRRRYNRT